MGGRGPGATTRVARLARAGAGNRTIRSAERNRAARGARAGTFNVAREVTNARRRRNSRG